MTTQTEALKLALEALEKTQNEGYNLPGSAIREAITAIKEALAQPEQEPVAVVETIGGYPDESAHVAKWLVPYKSLKAGDKLYTTPPQPKEPEHSAPHGEPVAWMEGESVYWHTNPSLNDWIRANGTPLYTTPPQRKQLTDAMVSAAARVLNDRQAEACGVDKDDQWKVYGEDFIEDARAMLAAAHGIKE